MQDIEKKPTNKSTEYNPEEEVRFFGFYSVIYFSLFLTLPFLIDLLKIYGHESNFINGFVLFITLLVALAGVVMPIAIARLVYAGSAIIASKIENPGRMYFQIFISLIVPAILSLCFVDFRLIELSRIGSNIFLLASPVEEMYAVIFVVLVSWSGSKLLPREYPFKAFVIVAMFFFVILYMGYLSDYLHNDEKYVHAKEYLGRYIRYISASYLSMFCRLVVRNKKGFNNAV